MIMVSVTGFFIRFLFFLLKIIGACLFVIVLQVQVGEKSIEQWIEKGLKESSISRYLTQTAVTGMDKLSQKFPALKTLVKDKNKLQKNNFYRNVVKQQLNDVEDKMNQLDVDVDNTDRIPSSDENSEK